MAKYALICLSFYFVPECYNNNISDITKTSYNQFFTNYEQWQPTRPVSGLGIRIRIMSKIQNQS